MKKSTKKFYRNGTDKQKRADIVFQFGGPDKKKIKEWSTSQKIIALAFLKDVFESYKEINKHLQEALINNL